LRPQVFTELFTGDGASYGRFTGEKFRLYPTTSRRFSIDVTRAPAGTYKAVVIADCGENDLFGSPTHSFSSVEEARGIADLLRRRAIQAPCQALGMDIEASPLGPAMSRQGPRT
jgi:hypothetical protein